MKKFIASALLSACVFALAGCINSRNREDWDQTGEAEPQVWVDYWNHEGMPWEGESDLNLPEYPEITFRWRPCQVTALNGENEKVLFEGMPIWNVFLADLNRDRRSGF